MTNHGPDTEIDAALSALRDRAEVPPVDPAREQTLLAAFDAHRARQRPSPRRWNWRWATAAAALLAITVALYRELSINTPGTDQTIGVHADDMTGFVSWPGAEAWPPFESGSLVRVDLPPSELFAIGLSPAAGATDAVHAEIVVAQDGLPRAIRLVQ